MPQPLRESAKLTEAATTTDPKSGRMTIQVMSPGWGSTGYYSPEVCEAAADLMPVGTQMYLDHPHMDGSGIDERGNRSVRDIAAVFTSEARWDSTTKAVVAECQVTAPYREFLADEHLAPHIGLSLRGSATDIVIGEAEGKRGPIIEGIADVSSVDFVTRAGRGGRVLKVLESAPPTAVVASAVRHGIAEATANETREQLQQQLRDTFGGEKSWVWVRDFDDTTVWYEHETPDEAGTYGITYEVADDGAVTISGSPTEVRATTTYVPVTRPDSNTPTTEESQEDTMGKIQIEESEHSSLVEKAGRVDALESENATLKAEKAAGDRRTVAIDIVTEAAKAAEIEFDEYQTEGLLAKATVTESGALDEVAFKTLAESAAAKVKERVTGTPGTGLRGFGESATPGAVTESGAPTRTAWGRPLAESKGA